MIQSEKAVTWFPFHFLQPHVDSMKSVHTLSSVGWYGPSIKDDCDNEILYLITICRFTSWLCEWGPLSNSYCVVIFKQSCISIRMQECITLTYLKHLYYWYLATHTHIHGRTHKHTCTYTNNTCAHTNTHVQIHTHTYACTYTHVHTQIHICLHTHTWTHKYTCAHTHTHTV